MQGGDSILSSNVVNIENYIALRLTTLLCLSTPHRCQKFPIELRQIIKCYFILDLKDTDSQKKKKKKELQLLRSYCPESELKRKTG